MLWIILGHITPMLDWDLTRLYLPFDLASSVYYAVDIFFILGGYLLTRSALQPEGFSLPAYWAKRATRVLPQYLLLLALAALLHTLVSVDYGYTYRQRLFEKEPSYQITEARAPGKEYVLRGQKSGTYYTLRMQKTGDTIKGSLTQSGRRTTFTVSEQTYRAMLLTTVGRSINLPERCLENTYIMTDRFEGESFLPYLVFMQNAPGLRSALLLSHLWYVALLVHFYLIFGLLLWLISRQTDNTAERARLLFAGLAALALLLLGAKFFMELPEFYNKGTVFRMDALLLGGLLYFAQKSLPERGAIQRALRWGALPAGVALVIAAIRLTPEEAGIRPGLMLVNYAGAGLIVLSAAAPTGPAGKLFGTAWAAFIGRHSYGIYLWHFPLMYYFLLLRKDYPEADNFLMIALFTALSVLIGSGMERLLGLLRPHKGK